MKYLLDTNVLSEVVKTAPNASVMEMIEAHEHELVTAAPVWHELQFGCQRLPESRKREIISSFLDDIVKRAMPILPYDNRAAEWHAQERARLSSQGLTSSFIDGQIAAISVVNDLVLVTRNTKDFNQFFKLKIENWYNE